MPRKESVLIDTSWFIESITDDDVKESIRKLCKSHVVKSCDIIHEKEIPDAYNFTKERASIEKADEFLRFYKSSIHGVIKPSPKILQAVDRYCVVGFQNRLLSRKLIDDMRKGDFIIVASASSDGTAKILTKNRKTMSKPEALKVYDMVNKQFNWRTPKILKTKEELLNYSRFL